MPMFDLELPVQGQSLPRIYDDFVALRKQIAKTEAELQSLQKKMRKEPQLDKQLMMNKQVKTERKDLERLQQQLKEFGV
jgi:cell shape-determining protein MreC